MKWNHLWEDAKDICVANDDCSQLKAGVSFQEYESLDNDIMCGVQNLNENFIPDVSEEEEGGEGGGRWSWKKWTWSNISVRNREHQQCEEIPNKVHVDDNTSCLQQYWEQGVQGSAES